MDRRLSQGLLPRALNICPMGKLPLSLQGRPGTIQLHSAQLLPFPETTRHDARPSRQSCTIWIATASNFQCNDEVEEVSRDLLNTFDIGFTFLRPMVAWICFCSARSRCLFIWRPPQQEQSSSQHSLSYQQCSKSDITATHS